MAVPDTVRGFIGLWGEYRRSEFLVTRFMNGFGEEDINLSATVALGLNVAPQAFGYESFSLGPTMFKPAGQRAVQRRRPRFGTGRACRHRGT
jgi:hypothetical protein